MLETQRQVLRELAAHRAVSFGPACIGGDSLLRPPAATSACWATGRSLRLAHIGDCGALSCGTQYLHSGGGRAISVVSA